MASTGKLLLRGSVLRLFHMGSSMLIGFFMMPFLINQLGTTQYGLWILIGSIISLFTLLDAGMIGVTQRFVVRAFHGGDNTEVNQSISTSFFLFIAISLVIALVTLIVILIGPYFFEQPENIPLFQTTIAILGFGTAINIPLTAFYGIITAKNRFDLLTYINIASLVVRTSLIVYFISQGSDISTLAFITVSMLASEKILAIILAKKMFKALKISSKLFKLSLIKKYFHFSKWVYLTTVADRIRFTIDDLVVAGLIGLSAVTHYTVAATLISYFGEVMASIFGVIGPSLNKYHKLNQWDNLRSAFFAITEVATIISCLIGGLLTILGPSFISTWIGTDYGDSYLVLIILLSSSIIAHSQRASVAILYAIAKHKYYSIVTSIEAAINLGLSLILGYYYGLYGIAFGTALPALITKLYFQPKYACKQIKVPYSSYLKLLLSRIFVSTIYFVIAYILIQPHIKENYLSLIFFGFILSTSYLLFMLLFMVSKETKNYISEILPGKIVAPMRRIKLL